MYRDGKKTTKFDPSVISQSQIGALREAILTDDHFLGSSVYDFVFDEYDDELYFLLFDGHSVELYERAGQRPSILIGRRGSGKSTYLNFVSQKPTVISVKIPTWDFLDLVEGKIRTILKRQGKISAEQAGDVWKLILLVVTCAKITQYAANNNLLKKFVKELPLKTMGVSSALSFAKVVIKKLQTRYLESDEDFDVVTAIQAISKVSTTLGDLEAAISNTLIAENKVAIVMMDNPERYTPEDKDLDLIALRSLDDSRKRTIAGLLNFIGRVNRGKVGFQARLCLPSEQYFYMRKLSDAEKKDFSTARSLHWSSGDLLSMAAHRYMIFLTAHPEYRDNNRYQLLLKHKIYTRDGSIAFWRFVFDDSVVNDRTIPEEPLVYLVRHTQLLPRQLIDYLNMMIRRVIHSEHHDLTRVRAQFVKEAVRHREFDNAAEIVSSYKYCYPEADQMFSTVLPRLPLIVKTKDILDTYYTQSNAKAVLNENSQFPQVIVSKERFLRFLLELGVYGKVKSQPKSGDEGYVNAEYEYTMSGSLTVDKDDILAMHPIFTGNMSENMKKMVGNNIKGIYPYGTDISQDGMG